MSSTSITTTITTTTLTSAASASAVASTETSTTTATTIVDETTTTEASRTQKPCERQQSSISSSSSMLTNSSNSPSSSLTSIPTSSPTSTNFSNSQSMRSVSISLNCKDTAAAAAATVRGVDNNTTSSQSAFALDQQTVNTAEDPHSLHHRTAEVMEGACSAGILHCEQQPRDGGDEDDLHSCSISQPDAVAVSASSESEYMCQPAAGNVAHVDTYTPSSLSNAINTNNEDVNENQRGSNSSTSSNCSSSTNEDDNIATKQSGSNRLERSNSCSQAEQTSAQLASATIHETTTSLSHENLINSPATASHGVCSSSSSTTIVNPSLDTLHKQTTADGVKPLENSSSIKQQTTHSAQNQQQATTSYRFFSSKLNTGSLWSLLSVGSNNSSSNTNEMATNDNVDSLATNHHHQQQQVENNDDKQQQQQQDNSNSNKQSTGGFFSRVQTPFKRSPAIQQQMSSQQQSTQQLYTLSGHQLEATKRPFNGSSSFDQSSMANNNIDADRKRFRFNVKYIGCAILHKNFTLPMLEWIAKDIKRQTIKGAQSTSQRKFTIPTRDITLEIQSYQLTAISCKDGHCIFVHSMQCVSKYAQLQHDPNCFSYIIRDTKESPYFCHVFQAKSANKVHDIFSAIREATTRTQSSAIHWPAVNYPTNQAPVSAPPLPPPTDHQPLPLDQSLSGGGSMIQKSASSDGQLKSLLGGSNISSLERQYSQAKHPPSTPPALTSATGTIQHQPSQIKPQLITSSGRAQSAAHQHHQQQQQQHQSASIQFENSYQFEVMFVKKVKLQCRRVPATFVDDALETLKSFEVLKGGESKAQIKGVGKRIISASVDERQEYDEAACQSPTPGSKPGSNITTHHHEMGAESTEDQRRGSSVSLHRGTESIIEEESSRESRSCQQSPTNKKLGTTTTSSDEASRTDNSKEIDIKKKHQSMDCLKSIDCSIKWAKDGNAPNFMNDFSPYNTITSTDLNERIAAIPVVSSSVSLDHETRQKLARQVRETIMATAASIKKGVYASGDKLDSSTSSKALDSLSCTVVSSVLPADDKSPLSMVEDNPTTNDQQMFTKIDHQPNPVTDNATSGDIQYNLASSSNSADQRRSSAGAGVSAFQHQHQSTNNFDLFRRASARQVVKNRTMLLLIGKDELCTISIDKHQMLFSKSFNSIVHCLQGNNNKDHFGLICRDSGKINPNTESYAGFIFKCQSDKVVREIMGALKQVIYSSQHNYHGYNSPYNPLNTVAAATNNSHPFKSATQMSPKLERAQLVSNNNGGVGSFAEKCQQQNPQSAVAAHQLSLAAKRGFLSPIEVDEAARHNRSSLLSTFNSQQSIDQQQQQQAATISSSPVNSSVFLHQANFTPSLSSIAVNPSPQLIPAPKNLIKSMFCDNCPLYWYHRLCCDIESLPADASKAIILRRIDSSLTDKEQDELYSRFSEFSIESIDEHNEIFMSLLRHQCERKQSKHNQSHSHLSAMAKSSALAKQQQQQSSTTITNPSLVLRQSSLVSHHQSNTSAITTPATAGTVVAHHTRPYSGGHQKSGSTSGSLAFVIGQSNANQAGQSIADAGSAAIDNLKKAKNSISVSIENMLKRRSSMKDEQGGQDDGLQISSHMPTRSGSSKNMTTELSAANEQNQSGSRDSRIEPEGNLKRSQSTSDYSNNTGAQQQNSAILSWKDSLSRTINDDLANPLVGLFRRRSSTFGSKNGDGDEGSGANNIRSSVECLSSASNAQVSQQHSPRGGPNSPNISNESRFVYGINNVVNNVGGGSSPSSMLSSAFWKKSIFDKIRQPAQDTTNGSPGAPADELTQQVVGKIDHRDENTTDPVATKIETKAKRTREELRSLWRKAIVEQITLLKMDKQNQRLQANAAECDIQRIKLNYRDVIYAREVPSLWDKLLKQDPTRKVEFVEVARLVRLGVPKQRRGEIWMFLMNQYQLRHGTSFQPADSEFRGDANQTYRSLLSQLSVQQHEIFVDIGRTFPAHPYYSQYLSIGQLSLFNLLKAYSLLDQKVGYCQGLSFVAGILLLHVNSEDEAFELMRHLLFNFGLRKQYLPSMNALHLQLYQITRLLRDHEYDLFYHFDHYDISPSLYAAPWFLTLFASQFPLGFVARLLDLIFLIGIEAIFRVSLNLLAYHRTSILDCHSLESTMDYMRNDLVNIEDKNLVKIFDKSMSLDLRNKLIEYEIEYTFYCAEDRGRSTSAGHSSSSIKQNAPVLKTSTPSTSYTNDQDESKKGEKNIESTSVVADATATIIIQHLLANNHLKSLRSNYSY